MSFEPTGDTVYRVHRRRNGPAASAFKRREASPLSHAHGDESVEGDPPVHGKAGLGSARPYARIDWEIFASSRCLPEMLRFQVELLSQICGPSVEFR